MSPASAFSHSSAVPDVPAVEVFELRKEFRRREGLHRRRVTALNPVSFSIERGECVAILGQNGSGKSTLVRLLSTLLLEDGGTARVFGHDVFREPRRVQRLINRVSVEASFFKRLSATENLSYAARFYGLRRRETSTEIPRILERVGFPLERATGPMEELSRGMQQKVALARALRDHDATVLLCTHDLVEAEQLAERVGILHHGDLLCLAPAAELKRRYRAETLEQAFFAATGAALDEEEEAGE